MIETRRDEIKARKCKEIARIHEEIKENAEKSCRKSMAKG
jgi:hypothetical protein